MAFTVETGARVPNANAYVTVAEFTAFHTDRGTDVSDFTTPDIQAAIVKATDYVDKRFGTRFVGDKHERSQSLQWPRLSAWTLQDDFIDGDEIPVELKRAIYEYAKLALYLELLPVPVSNFNSKDPVTGEVTQNTGGMLQRKREKVGPVEEDVWYSQEQWRLELQGRAPGVTSSLSSTINLPEYPIADEWLKPLVKTGMSVSLSRG